MKSRFQLVDVFHSEPLSGNPLAVVFDAADLTTAQMQQITRWLNLSETTFLVPPASSEADYGVRISRSIASCPLRAIRRSGPAMRG